MLVSCGDDDNNTIISVLPPATQTGENTFGCLIDGEVFIPDAGNCLGCIDVSASYEFVDGKYYLAISGVYDRNNSMKNISLFSPPIDSLEEIEYPLKSYENGIEYSAEVGVVNNTVSKSYFTSNEQPGLLTITKFDESNKIISGTFEFNAFTTSNESITITQGRFDVEYIQ